MDIINILVALVTIALGCFGFLAPHYTMGALNLKTDGSNMGMSEIRASVGCLFVAMGIACLWFGTAAAYFMLGVAYAGAATGRLVSLILDNPPKQKATVYFLVEAFGAVWLLVANA